MGKIQWTKWKGGHGAVKAESLQLGSVEMSVRLLPSGKWHAQIGTGGTMSLGEYDNPEEAEKRCLENARLNINESFGDLKAHEALVQIGKGHKGPKVK